MATIDEKDPVTNEKDDIVILEEDPALRKEDPAKEEPGKEDEKPDTHDEEDHDEPEPTTGTDAERAVIRERRRLEKLERKERREKAIGRDKLELEFLRKRNDDLERRLSGVEKHVSQVNVNQFDDHIVKAQNEVAMAEQVISKAVAAGNGDDVTQAMRYRDQALQKVQQLNYTKQQLTQQAGQSAPKGLDERTAYYAKAFMDEHKWYDKSGKSEDSAIVLAIDQGLAREGYRSDTEEYWEELRARTKRRLPERFKAQSAAPSDPTRTPRGGPAVGSGREHAPSSTRNEVYLSPERKQALVDAGVWDDPILRMKYAKRYAEYDRANKNNA